MASHLIKSTKLLFTGFFILIFFGSYSREKNSPAKDSSSSVELNGRIVVNTKSVRGSYKLEVLYRDAVINTFSIKNNGDVKLVLKKDKPYMIRISKEGFIPRYICVNTHLHDKISKKTFAFHLETDFIAVSEAMRLDDEALQLPIALISYNKQAGDFENNADYSVFVQQKIFSGANGIFDVDKD